MRRQSTELRLVIVIVGALLATVGWAPAQVQAAPATITNGTQFRDTTGNGVHAHGGGIVKVGSFYYWFGENRNADNTFKAVSVYRSANFRDWEFRRNVLTQSSAAELQSSKIERPKVIYNSRTGRYVMWMHKENGTDYSQARAAVASSATVDGYYTYHGSFRPSGPPGHGPTPTSGGGGRSSASVCTRVILPHVPDATGAGERGPRTLGA